MFLLLKPRGCPLFGCYGYLQNSSIQFATFFIEVPTNADTIDQYILREDRPSMIIPVNDRYRIASDPRQWIIQESRTRNGEAEWESRYYFVTLESAVMELREVMVRTSDGETLADGLADIEKVTTTLSRALTIDIGGLEDNKLAGRRDE